MSLQGELKCGVCEETINLSPLTCDRCKRQFHEKCVKPNDNLSSWICPKCSPYLNAPSAPRSTRQRSVTSKYSDKNKSTTSSNSIIRAQLELLEKRELLLQKQAQEKDAALAEKLKQLEEREKHLKQQEDEMKLRHLEEQEIIRKKSELLDTMCASGRGSEHSSQSSIRISRERVENWKTMFDAGLPNDPNKECTTGAGSKAFNASMPNQSGDNLLKNPVQQSTAIVNITSQKTFNAGVPNVEKIALSVNKDSMAVGGPRLMESQVPESQSHGAKKNTTGEDLLSTLQLLSSPSFMGSKGDLYTLPIYDGNVDDWPTFVSKYEETAPHFTANVNLMRLQKSLIGPARIAVKDLITMPSNTGIIIETLRTFFGRPEYIINSLLEKMGKESKLRADDFDSIISFALQVRNMCSTMQAAQLSEHLWNPILLQELTDKLPCQYKVSWAEFKVNIPAVNLEAFSAWIYEKALALASIMTKPPQLVKKGSSKAVNVHQDESKYNESKYQIICKICHGSCKTIAECEQFIGMSYSDRWKMIKLFDFCRCCLRNHRGNCRFSKECTKNGCSYKHHPMLHNDEKDAPRETLNAEVHSHNNITSTVLFKILPIKLFGKNNYIETFALLDDGSSVTLIEEELAKQLDIQDAVQDPLCLKWTSDEMREEHESMRFDTQISAKNGKKRHELLNVRTVNKLNLPIQSVDVDSIKSSFPYLKDIPIYSYSEERPKLLIGLDNSVLMLSSKSKSGGAGDPIAIKTRLGWLVYGGGQENISRVLHVCNCEMSAEKELSSLMKEFIALDNLNSSSNCLVSKEEQRAMHILNNSTIYNGVRYECSLLWKYDTIELPDSFDMAMKRLQCLEKKFQRDPAVKDIFQTQIQSYIEKGYIRRLSRDEVQSYGGRCWYLPIFIVKNPNKPKKIRVVWDAAATVNGVCLNSVLLKGPDLLVSLPGVLMRFREKRWAVTGDISEMFHQINVRQQDQQYQRFLWRSDPKASPQVYVMKVMTFGATCSPALAQYVKNTNASKFEKEYPLAYEAITANHYVDDWLQSVDTEENALQLAREVKLIHGKGGFEMRHWISNSNKVMEAMGEGSASKDLNLFSEALTEKVLGMWWCLADDSFTYSLRFNKGDHDVMEGKIVPTKRQLLRIIMSVYDPLGFLAHFMAYVKILMQMIWRKGIKWDEMIPDDLLDYWREWLKMLPEIENIRIPRFYFIDPLSNFAESTLELHVFVDGSEEGYAAVAYLRAVTGEQVVCKLISAKSRVAPLKHHSIPRLELLAAVLGVRLASTIEKEHTLKFANRFFWSDSRTVCSWIHSIHRRYKQYVACRVGEILESSSGSEWRWLPSSQNIADAATRMKLNNISNDCDWFCGPRFLYQSLNFDQTIDQSFHTNEEIRPSEIHSVLLHHAEIPTQRFSNWFRLLRTNAFVYRYICNLRAKARKEPLNKGPLNQSELDAAENIILRQSQKEGFPDEIVELRTSNPSKVNKKSKLYKLLPYLDENGILRHKGRLDQAQELTGDLKRPIILPYDNHVTDLLIQSYHRRYHHHNNETVVNEMRQRFHYPPLRKDLRKLRKRCQKCKNELAKPQEPVMANLPPCRLQNFTRPFTYVGIDYFGPFVVCVGRRNEKRWGVLATCLTFRAIHLECVSSLTTSSCILALRNFINRRGQPREMFSDNATTFKGASRELKELVLALDEEALATEFNSANMIWNFNPPTAAHMGGAWERLIGIVKKNLYYVSSMKNLQDELFRSLLIEVENIVNSRPLTYIPIDNEESEALTPNHFLLGSSSGVKPSGSFNTEGTYLRNNWHLSQQLKDIYYKRFLKEIIPQLNRRQKWYEDGKDIQVGDIVLVLNDNVPRYQFPKGRVLQVYPGRDGRVRSVSVKTIQGIYDRPVSKLAILDVLPEDGKTDHSRELTDFTEGSVTAAPTPITDSNQETPSPEKPTATD